MIPKTFTINEVFNNAILGLTFEFLSSKNLSFITEELAKQIGKKVTSTTDNEATPIWSNAILLKEYESKKPKYQLKLAFQDHPSLENIIPNILEWINKNAEVNDKTLLKVKLRFNNRNLDTLYEITNINKAKLILQIDEEKIYERFPKMKKSPYAISIKNILNFENLNIKNIDLNIINSYFNLPNKDYYAINLKDQVYGVLEFKYIGGVDYAENIKNVTDTIKYYISETYRILNTDNVSNQMILELNKINKKIDKYRKSYFDPSYFLREFKDVKVSVDLISEEQTIKTFWSRLRDPLMKLLLEGNMSKGHFNFDSELYKYEVKNATLDGPVISGMSIINCEISGLIENCEIWNSKFKRSRISNSTFNNRNLIEDSYLENCRVDRGNTINKSYIINEGEILNCKITESVIKNAGIGKNARLDESCTVIYPDEATETINLNKGIEIEEVRNYKWIKNLTKNNDIYKDFGNEYKNNDL